MALDKADIEHIRASWLLVRKDPVASGILLFKGLFTKFPQYLELFPQFADLDLDHMQENKRLLRHAVKVIETVTFVVDSIGDESASALLNEALLNLVRSHIRRKIGLNEFRSLGIVLIDFICDVNHRGGAKSHKNQSSNNDNVNRHCPSLIKSSSSSVSSSESDTMTSALDKLRASSHSPSSSSDEDNYKSANYSQTIQSDITDLNENFKSMRANVDNEVAAATEAAAAASNETKAANKIKEERNKIVHEENDAHDQERNAGRRHLAKLNTNSLVSAWTKLYGSVLDLVKREENSMATPATA